MVRLLGFEARPTIEDADPDSFLEVVDDDLDGFVGWGVLGAVAEDVAHDLIHVRPIAEHCWQPGRDAQGETAARPAGLLRRQECGQDALQQEWLAGHGVGPILLEPGQHEEILDQAVESLRLGLDVLDQLVARRCREVLTAAQHLRAGEDGRDRRAQLVREDAKKRLTHAACLSGGADVANEEDRPARGCVGGSDDGERTQLEPSLGGPP